MSYIISKDGTKLCYKTYGNGPAILLAHGMNRSKEIWLESGWVNLLKDFYTVVIVDIRGNGKSSKYYTSNFYSVEKILDDIDVLTSYLNLSEFNYFGHSYGGTIGLQLCKYNNKLKKCICAGSPFGDIMFKEVIPSWILNYRKYESFKKNLMNTSNYTQSENINWIKSTDFALNIAQMEAWTSWHGVKVEDVKCKLAIYTGSNDISKIKNNLIENKDLIYSNNIEFKVFNGLSHNDLIDKIDIVSPWILDFLNS